ncbi:MAG: hypothetical protein HeimC2_14340 [Candidatus Heimdallarchaeota archaeon LC_2]|nr:MAG: hypothetical protein HeimC2_14340 [Candidatus Heimdallarchaeota archaeon LC_2]
MKQQIKKLKETMNIGFEAIRLNIQDYESTKNNLKEVEGSDLNNVREETVYLIENKLLPPLKEALESKDVTMELLSNLHDIQFPQEQDQSLKELEIEIRKESGYSFDCSMMGNRADLSILYTFLGPHDLIEKMFDWIDLVNNDQIEAEKILVYILNQIKAD